MRYLLLLASMLVLCVAFGEAALPQFGNCTFRQAYAKELACFHTATQAFRKNPKANCGVHFNQMKNCVFVALFSCLRGSRTASQVREIVNNAYKSQSQYCDNAGIDIVTPLHKSFPCSSSFRTRQIACSSSLRAIWSRNRGDSRLCRKYSEAKKCVKALAATLCKLTGSSKELFDFLLDSYNPFCVSGKDPVDIPKLTTTKQPTTKAEAPITTAKISTPPVPNIFSTRRPTTLFMRPIRPSLLAEVVRIIKVLVDSFNRLLRIVEWAIRVGSSLARISSFKRDITSQMDRIDREVDRVPSFLSEEPGDDYTRNVKRDYINTRMRANKLLKLIEEAEAKRNDANEYNIIGQSASFACYNLGHN